MKPIQTEQSGLAQQTALHPNPEVCSSNKIYHSRTGFAERCAFANI